MMKWSLLFLGNLSLFGQELREANEVAAIVTDRPDQTESSSTVAKGTLQLETGAFYEKVSAQFYGVEKYTYNTTLIRYGLLERLELRLGVEVAEEKFRTFKGSGFSPLLLGVKIPISFEKGILPEMAFIGQLHLPFLANPYFKPDYTSVNFRFAFTHTLNSRSSLAYNLGMTWDGFTPVPTFQYTVAYAYSFTEKIGAYVEAYGDVREDATPSHLWNVGCTYLLSNDIQLDASAGTGITNDTQDYLLSAGISIRIPKL